jgi:hypothetical protein
MMECTVHRPPSMADCPSKVENKLLAKKNSQVLHQHQKRHEQTSAIHFACQVDRSERATRTVAFILWLSFRFCPQHVRASLLSAPNRCAVVRDPGCWPHHIGPLAHWAHWHIVFSLHHQYCKGTSLLPHHVGTALLTLIQHVPEQAPESCLSLRTLRSLYM